MSCLVHCKAHGRPLCLVTHSIRIEGLFSEGSRQKDEARFRRSASTAHKKLVCRVLLDIRLGLTQTLEPFESIDSIKRFACHFQSIDNVFPCPGNVRVDNMVDGALGFCTGRDDFDDRLASKVDRQPAQSLGCRRYRQYT